MQAYPLIVFLTTGEVAIGAAILTATAGFVGSWWQSRRDDKRWQRERDRERERWKREDERQWIMDRRQLYAKYFSEVDTLTTMIRRVLLDEEKGIPADEAYRVEVVDRRRIVRRISNEILLLAPLDLHNVTNAVWSCLLPLLRICQDGDLFDERRQLEAALGIATREFFDLARRDLGLVTVWQDEEA